jgi:hypothetical protein
LNMWNPTNLLTAFAILSLPEILPVLSLQLTHEVVFTNVGILCALRWHLSCASGFVLVVQHFCYMLTRLQVYTISYTKTWIQCHAFSPVYWYCSNSNLEWPAIFQWVAGSTTSLRW